MHGLSSVICWARLVSWRTPVPLLIFRNLVPFPVAPIGMNNLGDKQFVVFYSYMLAAGSTLSQMAQVLEGKGANVTGMFKYRDPKPDKKFEKFASSLT